MDNPIHNLGHEKSKILSRINKQKIGLNNLDLKRINITTKKPITESNNNISEKINESKNKVEKLIEEIKTFENVQRKT